MNGIVLWYKYDKKIGLVWCDDQGPLACITSETIVGSGFEDLDAGDQVVVETSDAGGMRQVHQVISRRRGSPDLDVQAMLLAEVGHQAGENTSAASDASEKSPSVTGQSSQGGSDAGAVSQPGGGTPAKGDTIPPGHLRVVA